MDFYCCHDISSEWGSRCLVLTMGVNPDMVPSRDVEYVGGLLALSEWVIKSIRRVEHLSHTHTHTHITSSTKVTACSLTVTHQKQIINEGTHSVYTTPLYLTMPLYHATATPPYYTTITRSNHYTALPAPYHHHHAIPPLLHNHNTILSYHHFIITPPYQTIIPSPLLCCFMPNCCNAEQQMHLHNNTLTTKFHGKCSKDICWQDNAHVINAQWTSVHVKNAQWTSAHAKNAHQTCSYIVTNQTFRRNMPTWPILIRHIQKTNGHLTRF